MNQTDNLLDIVNLLWRKRKTIIYACIIAFIGTAIISLLLPNYYQSETVFYAANPSLGNPRSLTNSEKAVDHYGSNKDLDRLFTIANSSELFDQLNQKYDFYSHYNIDPKASKAKSKLRKKFKKNFQLLKTEFDAFSLSFEDKSPDFSAEVTNEARNLIDDMAQKLIKKSQSKQIQSLKDGINIQDKTLNVLVDSSTVIKNEYNLFNVEAQELSMAEFSTGINFKLQEYKSKKDYYSNNKTSRDSLKKYTSLFSTTQMENEMMNTRLTDFVKGSNIIKSISKEVNSITGQLNLAKEKLKSLKSSFETPFNALHIVEKATVPDNKSRPKRSIYVIAVTLLTFIFTVLILILLNSYRNIEWKTVLKDD